MRKINWDHAKVFIDLAQHHYREEEFTQSWTALFLFEEETYRPKSTARQKEIQRLWQQRGMLERLNSNLSTFQKELKWSHENFEADIIQTTINIVLGYISFNRQSMASVKERISK